MGTGSHDGTAKRRKLQLYRTVKRKYKVEEVMQPGWVQTEPASPAYYEMELNDNYSMMQYAFGNKQQVSFDETAWAANGEAGDTRFLPAPGNWATYAQYTLGSGTADTPAVFTLFAGQTHYVGQIEVYNDDSKLYVKYVIDADAAYKDGYYGEWSLALAHLAVADTPDGIPRTFNKKTGLGSHHPDNFPI
jgi:hypothetical protein